MFNYKKDWDENQAKVHSDDEDSHNANSAIVKFKGEEKKLDGPYLGVITVVENTDFFIAKIKTKK